MERICVLLALLYSLLLKKAPTVFADLTCPHASCSNCFPAFLFFLRFYVLEGRDPGAAGSIGPNTQMVTLEQPPCASLSA